MACVIQIFPVNQPRFKKGSKNIILIIISALIVAGAFALAEYRNREVKKVVYSAPITATTPTADALSPDLQLKDTDNDGLKDWEEVLLGTDPDVADTDKDGTSDGKEVAANRNPLIKGPKDTIAATSAVANATNQKLSQTDKIARDFFAKYMELKQLGLSTDKTSQQQLVGQVLRSGIVLETPKTYTLKDILTISDNSPASVKQYGNELGAIFKKYVLTKSRNETVIAKDSLDNDDPEILKELDPIIASYRNILNAILKVKAPQTLTSTHLGMVNGMSSLLFVSESLRKIDKDALSGIQGTNTYLAATQGLARTFDELKGYFKSLGITYTAAEGGSFFKPTT